MRRWLIDLMPRDILGFCWVAFVITFIFGFLLFVIYI